MSTTHLENFAEFASRSAADGIPSSVADETKRIVLDAIGCALAGRDVPLGRMGIDYGHILGGTEGASTIIGMRAGSSLHGAAFANAELISALDLHSISLPGHVAPYVVAVALGMGEQQHRSGADVLAAVAVCHEMSFRFTRSMDQNRDIKDGKADTSPVLGYSNTVFGTTAAAAMLKGMSQEGIASALGIAGSTTPVNAHRSWLMHSPPTTIKYNLMPGGLVTTALAAALMADLGHRGDVGIVDDAEFGYPRFIGTRRWEPSQLTTALGDEWRFTSLSYFKPYPHCRVTHGVMDALIDIVNTNGLTPEEIDHIDVYGEAWASDIPTFMNNVVESAYDAQFCFTHGIAMAAHTTVTPGKDWQDPTFVFSESVLVLKTKVQWHSHPDWAAAVTTDPAARPSRVKVAARGHEYVADRNYPKGSPSPDPSTYMTTDELIAKFMHNATDVIDETSAAAVVDAVMNLENVTDVGAVMNLLRPAGS